MKIQSLDGEKYYLVEVIAFVLLHLKNKFMSHLSKSGIFKPSPFEFDWVITIPAIWKAGGKQMMREAATLVSTVDPSSLAYYYASVGGATGHTIVSLCICVCICLSVAGFLVTR